MWPRESRLLAALFCVVGLAAPRLAVAQPSEERVAEEPTRGVHLPTAGLAGEQDATAISVNPAGLFFVGSALGLAVDIADDEEATGAGGGGGLFWSMPIGGGVAPRLGFGLALEWLQPARARLAPDPGSPARFTMATALGLGDSSSLGLSWHHFFDDDGAALAGVDTFDLGYAARFGAHVGAGFVVRDLTSPTVAKTPVQRRYELELALRPTGTDRLELGLGGRIGETRFDVTSGQDLDGWLRFSARILRGVYLRGEVASQSLNLIRTTATGTDFDTSRELRMVAGLELSFGALGVATYGTGALDSDGAFSGRSGTLVLRVSGEEVPSLLPTGKRIEKLELSGGVGQQKLTSLVARLRTLRTNDDVVGLFVEIDGLEAGWATVRELRSQLLAVREAGKMVLVYMVAGNTRQYFLASAADAIFVDPAGGLRLTGFSGTSLYFKGLFDKLGIQAQFEKIAEFKSAPEAWTRTGPTEPALTMRNALFDELYDQIVTDIATGRRLSKEQVVAFINGGPYTAGDLAKMPELIDGIVTPDDLSETVGRRLGSDVSVGAPANERAARWAHPKIAVIYIVGDIVSGTSSTIPILGRQLVGSETIVRAIQEARADDDVKAIILRINSPGGSALASEIMAREVFKTRGVKPILCSLGDIAASGGYFAAAGCDRILADPMTITGSIGIFNGKFDVSGLLSRLGLTWVTYQRGERSDMDSFYRGYTDEERALMQEKLRYYYGRFVDAVARGRGMTKEQVDAVGRGRVWTGTAARKIGLIDQFGGMDEALTLAKQAAGLGERERVQLVYLPRAESSVLQRLLKSAGVIRAAVASPWSGLLPESIGRDLGAALPASLWHEPEAAQARLPFAIRLGDVTH